MKVLFLTTNWPSESSPINGLFVREHARTAGERAQVRVLAIERAAAVRGAVEVVPAQGEEPPVWSIRYRRYGRPISYAAFILGPLAAYRRLRRQGFEPDVLHAHSFLAALPALALGGLYRKPVVYTEHWTIFLTENPGRLSRPLRLAARFALRRADLVLPVSEHLGEALHRIAPTARLRVVPNVVDDAFHPDQERSRNGPLRLLTAGLLDTPRKGVDILLEAMALLRACDGVVLDVVGDGSNRSEYEQLSRRLGLERNVIFHGLRTKSELAELMRRADLFVLASRYENNPCVLLEALASGLPAVATRVGGVPEVVEREAGVLVAAEDPSSLAKGLGEALGRLDGFDRAEIARRTVERYGRDTVAQMLADVYAEVTAPKASLPSRAGRRLGRPRRRLALRRAMHALGYERVFGIGAARTGTSSLGRAFVLLGFRHTSWDPALWDAYERGDYDPIFRTAERFESFEDGPWNAGDLYRELDRRFPGSKFVLTVREPETWIVSHERHFSTSGAWRIPQRFLIRDYGAQRDQILEDYVTRNRAVADYFHSRPQDLLVLNVCGGEGWPELCGFLGLAPPEEPFPHQNAAEREDC